MNEERVVIMLLLILLLKCKPSVYEITFRNRF